MGVGVREGGSGMGEGVLGMVGCDQEENDRDIF